MTKKSNDVIVFDWHELKNLPEEKIRELREKLNTGSDIDGVICYYDIDKKDYRPFKLHEYHSKAIPSKYSKRQVDVFITGRKKPYWRTTLKWMAKHGIQCNCLIMFPRGEKKSKETFDLYKSEVVNLLQLEIYFEDDPRVVENLRKNCPNTKIILVDDVKPTKSFEYLGFKIDPEIDDLFCDLSTWEHDNLKEDIKKHGIKG